MMKPAALALLGMFAVASPAIAGKAQPKKPSTTNKVKCGDTYVVGDNRDKKTLTDAQIAEAMKANLADVDTCWKQVPVQMRKADTTAVLHFDIDDIGEVQTVDVVGSVPADAQRCISIAAAHWQFPDADDSTQADYTVTLRAK
jgi:hypothetical protein